MVSDMMALLGLKDDLQKELIEIIDKITRQRLAVLLGVDEVPENLEYIVTEVAVSRFNRIGAEGASSHTVDGESLSFLDDDFKPYEKEMAAYLSKAQGGGYGAVRFL